MEEWIEQGILLVKQLYNEYSIDVSHGLEHAINVLNHSREAIKEELSLSDMEKMAVTLASLLHDVDDRKYFKTDQNLDNARSILNEVIPSNYQKKDELISLTLELISLVSCSKNKNTDCQLKWKLIPRDCDRLEAIGKIGILRCFQYCQESGNKLYTNETLRATTIDELKMIASSERFANYQGNSESMIDHFYDKLLHLNQMKSNNKYILDETNKRYQCMIDFCLMFGQKGNLTVDDVTKFLNND